MEKDNKTDSKKNPKADADHPDVGLENKTKNKGSYTHRGFKKASEVRHHPGLQVNNSIGSSPDSDNGSENHPFENSSENSDEKKTFESDHPETKTKKGSLTNLGFKTEKVNQRRRKMKNTDPDSEDK